jgi:hypothetical protein
MRSYYFYFETDDEIHLSVEQNNTGRYSSTYTVEVNDTDKNKTYYRHFVYRI